jgi:hypothetical protein
MGAPPEVLAQARANAGQRSELRILPCNLAAVRVFWSLSTQWRTGGGMGGAAYTGLDYTALPVVLRLHGITRASQARVFDSVRVMEAEALKVMRQR